MTNFPSFLGAPRALRASDAGGAAAGLDLVVPGFELTCQEHTNWCWAAVTQAVERVLAGDFAQATIASDHVGLSHPEKSCDQFDPDETDQLDCAPGNCAAHCNSPHSLFAVLTERNRLQDEGLLSGKIAFDQLKAEIANHRPVPCRIQWNGTDSGAHFVCVAGVSDGGGQRFVHVFDPLSPGIGAGAADRLTMRFETFRDAYVDLSTGTRGAQSHAYLVG